MSLTPGTQVQVRNAFGEVIHMVAVSSAEAGRDFPVVWVCSPDEYVRAQREGGDPQAIAWPLDAVMIPEPA